jgi:hypothetical protein
VESGGLLKTGDVDIVVVLGFLDPDNFRLARFLVALARACHGEEMIAIVATSTIVKRPITRATALNGKTIIKHLIVALKRVHLPEFHVAAVGDLGDLKDGELTRRAGFSSSFTGNTERVMFLAPVVHLGLARSIAGIDKTEADAVLRFVGAVVGFTKDRFEFDKVGSLHVMILGETAVEDCPTSASIGPRAYFIVQTIFLHVYSTDQNAVVGRDVARVVFLTVG